MSDRDNHDAGLAERIAAALRADLEASRQPAAPRPPAAPVPDWLFGPRHRELDVARRAAAEAARQALPAEAITGYAVPVTPEATEAPRPTCPCCLQPMPREAP